MAGPHVVGEVALLWSAYPKLIGKIKETTEIIRASADPSQDAGSSCGGIMGTATPNNTYGYGRINADAATK